MREIDAMESDLDNDVMKMRMFGPLIMVRSGVMSHQRTKETIRGFL